MCWYCVGCRDTDATCTCSLIYMINDSIIEMDPENSLVSRNTKVEVCAVAWSPEESTDPDLRGRKRSPGES